MRKKEGEIREERGTKFSSLVCDVPRCNNVGQCNTTGLCVCPPIYDDARDCKACSRDHYVYPSCSCMSTSRCSYSMFFYFILIIIFLYLDCNAIMTCYGNGYCDGNGACVCAEGFNKSTNCSTCSVGFQGYPSCSCMFFLISEPITSLPSSIANV